MVGLEIKREVLIGELAGKMSPDDWIARYESAVKR